MADIFEQLNKSYNEEWKKATPLGGWIQGSSTVLTIRFQEEAGSRGLTAKEIEEREATCTTTLCARTYEGCFRGVFDEIVEIHVARMWLLWKDFLSMKSPPTIEKEHLLMAQEKEHTSSANGGGVNGVVLFHDEYFY